MSRFAFDLLQGAAETARLGRLTVGRRRFETPLFMPVGTAATVKGMTPRELAAMGASIVLCNTYHLLLRPGPEAIRQLGGLHRFMAWGGGILTDSGGFQVFSQGELRRIDDDGVTFRSHLDGTAYRLAPEDVIEIQTALGPDIMMPLDECAPYPIERAAAAGALRRTEDWLARSRAARRHGGPVLFGIAQGSVFGDLRRAACRRIADLDLAGSAIGGLSVGEPKPLLFEMVEVCCRELPPERPRYLMGVGTPSDLLEAVARGVDMFDCVLPTRNARNGMLFTSQGRISIRNASHRLSDEPLDPACRCPTCRTFSRGYLRHLFMSRELLAYRANTVHNLTFYLDLMRDIRQSMRSGTFAGLVRERSGNYREQGI